MWLFNLKLNYHFLYYKTYIFFFRNSAKNNLLFKRLNLSGIEKMPSRRKRKRVRCAADEDSSDEDCGGSLVCRTNNNHILFYADVNPKTVAKFRKIILTLEEEAGKTRTLRCLKPYYLHIYSLGGDAYLGLALYDIMMQCKLHTIGIVEGMCASAASLLLMGCKQRIMTPHSFLLFHQLSVDRGGKCYEVAQELANMEKITSHFLDIYSEHSSFSRKQLEAELANEKDMDSATALKYGFVTQVTGDALSLAC